MAERLTERERDRALVLQGRDGIARAAYVACTGQRLTVLHVFVMKTQATPRRAFEFAIAGEPTLGWRRSSNSPSSAGSRVAPETADPSPH